MLEGDGGGATKWELKGTCLLLISNEKEKEGNRNGEGREHHKKYMYKAPLMHSRPILSKLRHFLAILGSMLVHCMTFNIQ